jgi:hypothetical protein
VIRIGLASHGQRRPGRALIGGPRLRRVRTLTAGAVLGTACCLVAVPLTPAGAATAITVNGTSAGRTFDGIGAISGGGGNTRLLTDYPAAPAGGAARRSPIWPASTWPPSAMARPLRAA